MLFNSYEFIVFFLPLTLLGYFSLNRMRYVTAASGWLVLASFVFYSWWNPAYMPLLAGSVVFNYSVGTVLARQGRPHGGPGRRGLLMIGVAANLALLGYYKYTGFLMENANALLGANLPVPRLLLPLAISFFTFQQIAYLVDSYQGRTREYDFLNYTVFVTFFPQLIAGPIVHHAEMMPQFARLRNKIFTPANVSAGLMLFAVGLFKKVGLADHLSVWVNEGYANADRLYMAEAWVTSLSYTLQIYFDFSGYTDMAMGVALMFNIKLPANFETPYRALNIQDFWRRWHMTLSRFLRDYVYIPLGGNRSGALRTMGNLFVTFPHRGRLARGRVDLCDLGRAPRRGHGRAPTLVRQGHEHEALGRVASHLPLPERDMGLLPGRVLRAGHDGAPGHVRRAGRDPAPMAGKARLAL